MQFHKPGKKCCCLHDYPTKPRVAPKKNKVGTDLIIPNLKHAHKCLLPNSMVSQPVSIASHRRQKNDVLSAMLKINFRCGASL